jgi:hypothetical protein
VGLLLKSKNGKYRGCKVLTLYFSNDVLNARGPLSKRMNRKGLTLTVPINLWVHYYQNE